MFKVLLSRHSSREAEKTTKTLAGISSDIRIFSEYKSGVLPLETSVGNLKIAVILGFSTHGAQLYFRDYIIR